MARHDGIGDVYSPAGIKRRQEEKEQYIIKVQKDAIDNGCAENRASEFTNKNQIDALIKGYPVDAALHCKVDYPAMKSFCVAALDAGVPAEYADIFSSYSEITMFMDAYLAGVNSVNCSVSNIAGKTDAAVEVL